MQTFMNSRVIEKKNRIPKFHFSVETAYCFSSNEIKIKIILLCPSYKFNYIVGENCRKFSSYHNVKC